MVFPINKHFILEEHFPIRKGAVRICWIVGKIKYKLVNVERMTFIGESSEQ